MSERASYEDRLAALAADDERVVVLTAENRAAIRGLERRLGPRLIDVGICEQTLIGAAAGLALCGRVPVVHALAAFLTARAYEQIRTDVGLAGLPVKLVGYVPGVLSTANGPTHQAIDDVALMRAVPGMQIVCPADLDELLALLPQVVASPQPCYVRYADGPPAVARDLTPTLGKAVVLAEGQDVSLLTYGVLLPEVERARLRLSEAGLSVGLVHLPTLEPFDKATLVQVAERSRLLVTVEDHQLHGGLYAMVAETLVARGGRSQVLPIALSKSGFRPTTLQPVLQVEGLSSERIAARVLETWKGRAVSSTREHL